MSVSLCSAHWHGGWSGQCVGLALHGVLTRWSGRVIAWASPRAAALTRGARAQNVCRLRASRVQSCVSRVTVPALHAAFSCVCVRHCARRRRSTRACVGNHGGCGTDILGPGPKCLSIARVARPIWRLPRRAVRRRPASRAQSVRARERSREERAFACSSVRRVHGQKGPGPLLSVCRVPRTGRSPVVRGRDGDPMLVALSWPRAPGARRTAAFSARRAAASRVRARRRPGPTGCRRRRSRPRR